MGLVFVIFGIEPLINQKYVIFTDHPKFSGCLLNLMEMALKWVFRLCPRKSKSMVVVWTQWACLLNQSEYLSYLPRLVRKLSYELTSFDLMIKEETM